MLQRPAFQPHLRVKHVAGEGVFVLSEVRQLILQGRFYELVMPQLDGRPVEDVCRQLKGQASPAQVFYTINSLQKRGLLCEAAPASSAADAALWTIQDIDPAMAAERLANTAVSVHGLGVDAAPFCSLLKDVGVQVEGEGTFGVVLTDSYLHPGLGAYNRESLRTGRPWLLAKPLGTAVWIGPLFRPGKTACWACLAERIRANFPVLGLLDGLLEDGESATTDVVQSPATLSAAFGLTANTVARWIAGDGDLPQLESRLQTIDLIALQSQSHLLLKQPACRACGQPQPAAEAKSAPLILQSRRKIYTEDGGHRAVAPQQTLDKYGHHVSAICGAVTMLERSAPSNDGVMHVYVSGNNIARGPDSLFNLRVDLRNSSAGKGINELQAKASALCEGLERYCAVFRGDEPTCTATFLELAEQAIHPNDCMQFSDKQYAGREQFNAGSSIYNYIPPPFEPDCRTQWSPVWSLTRNAVRYLPTGFCYFNVPHEPGKGFATSCSNGNSAGNTLEEAVLQGFFELVERDAVGIWWYNRVRMPGLDLDSFEIPYLDQLRAFLKTRHRDLWALDITNDLGIPAVAALSHRTDGRKEQIMFGFGAHLDPRIALLRAVTELNQMLVPILDCPPDGPPPHLTDEDTVEWLQKASLEGHGYLLPQDAPPRTAGSYPQTWTDDLRDDVLVCQSIVERLGLEMLVLDQTRPEIALPVVKVVVPGLRHFWTRFAPGRLYDVPVKLGWLDQPLAEEELNPMPMFL